MSGARLVNMTMIDGFQFRFVVAEFHIHMYVKFQFISSHKSGT